MAERWVPGAAAASVRLGCIGRLMIPMERNRLSRFTGPNHDQTAHNNGTDTEAGMIKQRKQRFFGVTGLGEAQRPPYQ